MSSAIYNVGVHLSAHDGISGVLANISHSMLGLHGGVEQLNRGFSNLQAGVLGAAAVAAGVSIGHVVGHLVEHGMELKHWQAQLSAAGFTSQEVAAATAKAWSVAGSNMNTTASENLKNIIELNKATGNLAESMKLLPTFAMAENVIQSVKATDVHSRMSGNSTQTLNFARGLEELGVTTKGEAEVEKYAKEFMKTMISSRGLFDGNQLYALTNSSGMASRNWDMNMATVIAPILGEIMKSSKMGNADYMALRTYQGGTITSKAAKALVDHHLAKLGGEDDANADVFQDKKGYHLKANSNLAKGMETNLWDWSTELLKNLKATGVDVSDPKAINGLTNEIGSNKSVTMLMRALLDPQMRTLFEKEFANRNKVKDEDVGGTAGNDPWMKLDALKKKWDDFLTALGGPLIEPAMKTLDVMTHAINDWAQYFVNHPGQAEMIGKSLVAVSGGLAAVGTVLIGTAIVGAIGAGGWLVVGIAALGAAVAALHSGDWKDLEHFKPFGDGVDKFFETYFRNIKDGVAKDFGTVDQFFGTYFKNIRAGVTKDFDVMLKEVESWPVKLGTAIEAMGKSLVAMIGAELKGVAGQVGGWFGGLFHKSSFESGGFNSGGGLLQASWDGAAAGAGGAGNAKVIAGTIAGGISNSNVVIMNGGGGLGGGGGEFGGGGGGRGGGGHWGGHALPVGGGAGVGHAASAAERASFIRATAAKYGIDPEVALRVAQSEGFYKYTGDHGMSFGDFQMYTGGGLGNIALAHGINIRDPKNWKAADELALSIAAHKHSWADWHGARAVGIGNGQGFGYRPTKMPGGPPARTHEHHITVPVHLDGKVMARVVTKHQTRMATMPHAIGGQDDYGSWASPGTTMMPA